MEQPRPRIAWRLALLIVLAVFATQQGIGAIFETTTTCSGGTDCAVFHVLAPAVFFGGWVGLLVAVVGWAVLRFAAPRRAAWPANAALAVTAVLLFAVPVYDHFRDGWSGTSREGRERQQAATRARLVEIVDGTVRAVAPDAPPHPAETPTREPNSTDSCERETYAAGVRAGTGGAAAVLAKVAEHWRSLGFDVRASASSVGADAGGQVWLSASETPPGTVDVFGHGPCRKPS